MTSAAALALSVVDGYRRPARPRTIVVQVAAFLASVIFACMVRHLMRRPFISLMQGIGTENLP